MSTTKNEPVDTEAMLAAYDEHEEPESAPVVTEEVPPAPPPKPEGRQPWCEGCFGSSLDRGPEAKLDASGHPVVFSAEGERCHVCEKPATRYAPYLVAGSTFAHRDGAKVCVVSTDPLRVLDVGAHPSCERKASLDDLVCL